MAQPTLSQTAQRLYDAMAPLAWDDEAQGWALAHFCQALALSLDEVADMVEDDDVNDRPGYAGLFDIDTVAEKYLPYIAQFIGVDIPGQLTDTQKRIRIKETAGWKRGTVDAIKGAARQYLTGTGTVYVVERHGSAYKITVTTLTSETPDVAATTAAIQAQIPAGLVFTHSVVSPSTFAILRDTHASFDAVKTMFVNFAEIAVNPSKQYNYDSLLSTYPSYANLASSGFTDYDDLRTAS